jgi:hypothetical protein
MSFEQRSDNFDNLLLIAPVCPFAPGPTKRIEPLIKQTSDRIIYLHMVLARFNDPPILGSFSGRVDLLQETMLPGNCLLQFVYAFPKQLNVKRKHRLLGITSSDQQFVVVVHPDVSTILRQGTSNEKLKIMA